MPGEVAGSGRVEAVAEEVLAVLGSGRQLAPFTDRRADFGLEEAYRVTAEVRRRREAAGERPVGRKIGFTNRTIWAEYGVHQPIWGYVYDRTLVDLAGEGPTRFPLAGLAEPRIEPEIVFGLAAAPEPGMDATALLGCIDWVAHGIEIVQSFFPGWRFAVADTVAACGLHGALLVGPRHRVAERPEGWLRELAGFEIELFRGGALVDRGQSANVLDGPLLALRHLVEVLAADPDNPPLAAGEIVTTGTVTRAFPVAPGESWTTAPRDIPLEGARLTFV